MLEDRELTKRKMAANELHTAGLGEQRMRPYELENDPFNFFAPEEVDNIITGCQEIHLHPFNALTPHSTTVTYQVDWNNFIIFFFFLY